MRNFFGKCATIGLLGAGFALTGDLGWLASRGRRVLDATTVPAETPRHDGGPDLFRQEPPAIQIDQVPAGEAPDPRAHVPPPPGSGVERIDLAGLAAGDRLLVWFPAVGSSTGQQCVMLDIVEPISGEALLHRHPGDADPGAPVVASPPRRVTIHGPVSTGLFAPVAADRSLSLGGTIHCRPVGIAHEMTGRGGSETFGPITGLTVRKQESHREQ